MLLLKVRMRTLNISNRNIERKIYTEVWICQIKSTE